MPVPFASFNLDPRLLEGVRDLGFTETRPIQTAVIPLALAGHDLIACAATGTGKTAAFVVPMLQWLLATASDATGADGTGMANVDLVAQAFSSAPRSPVAAPQDSGPPLASRVRRPRPGRAACWCSRRLVSWRCRSKTRFMACRTTQP